MKLVSILLLLITYCIQIPFNKCELEKKKRNECRVRNLLLCEISSDAERYRKIGVDICTNPDGYAFVLFGVCDGHLSYECGGNSSSSKK